MAKIQRQLLPNGKSFALSCPFMEGQFSDMQIYLGNAKGAIPFDQIIDNSFAEKAVASANERAK